jgi:hypothetical protein
VEICGEVTKFGGKSNRWLRRARLIPEEVRRRRRRKRKRRRRRRREVEWRWLTRIEGGEVREPRRSKKCQPKGRRFSTNAALFTRERVRTSVELSVLSEIFPKIFSNMELISNLSKFREKKSSVRN